MTEAYIVATARSPIGRAYKGSLKNTRADDLAAQMIRAAMAALPGLDPARVDDLLLGCGLPGGGQGMNMARIVAVMLGWDTVPGATVTRYCASSLQTTRMAFHAIKAGEGDVFVSAGAESVSGMTIGSSDHIPGRDLTNPSFADALARTFEHAEGGAPAWTDPRETGNRPDPYIPMGQTAENVASSRGITREEQDAFAARSQQRAEKAIAEGFWARDITPVTLADGTVVSADDGPRPGTTVERLATLAPVFRPDGTVTAGNACPLNDGAAAVVIVSERVVTELGLDRSRASSPPASAASHPRSWASGRSRPAGAHSPARASASATWTSSRSTRPSPPRSSPRPANSASTRRNSTSKAARSPWATPTE
ncbi:acetyl-CoA C-acetyltransferase [Phytomonospora endophytica]|uniref:Acetyl-CoA C-acetyltransferase n=1 Tax=Phytomonospora endophytica TaxID=714109 RepID=A0A841FIJ1_9ACTN|nr:acetyl-CoA C-acetyltransferase [Phytomonospora endophytica]GIG70053.1 hypothetical protein Pen01_63480 [Phytomonospora endophytica]